MQIIQDVVKGVTSKDQDNHLPVLSYDMEIPSLQVLLHFKEKDSLELLSNIMEAIQIPLSTNQIKAATV